MILGKWRTPGKGAAAAGAKRGGAGDGEMEMGGSRIVNGE
jgi:hypothetical protein